MKKDNYLINYYKNNNLVMERVNIKKKIIIRIVILMICSLIYWFMATFKSLNKFHGGIELLDTFNILKLIMIITTIVVILSLISLLLIIVFHSKLKHILEKITFRTKKIIFTFMDWFMILPICIVVTVFCFSYLFIITPVDGESMMPNIYDGEYVVVSYYKEIKRDSVVVLEVNKEDNILQSYDDDLSHYIKRIVGLPGDTIKIENNLLYINGFLYNQTYYNDEDIAWSYCKNFNGAMQYKNDDGTIATTFVIPEDYYFVMGDNRAGSKDSREIGLIKEENIIGVATLRMQYLIPRGKL